MYFWLHSHLVQGTVDQIMVHVLDFCQSLFVSIFLVDVNLKMAHGQ